MSVRLLNPVIISRIMYDYLNVIDNIDMILKMFQSVSETH